jgi:hypothetical protein
MKKLDEIEMLVLEELIPFLVEDAVKKARTKTLQSGRSVVEAVDGKLIESHPDYRHVREVPVGDHRSFLCAVGCN